MELSGIIENVFHGVTIFRGYATLKALAKLSYASHYQRDYEKDRIDEILHYMKDSQFVFFPELILGWQIEEPGAILKIKEHYTTSISIENKIRITKASSFDLIGRSEYEKLKAKVVTIEIPDNINNKIFSRIDGNHRLVVIDKIVKEKKESNYKDVCDQVVPYCLIIQQKDKNNEAEKQEAAYFYLINSKAKPLTTDDNLKAILTEGLFSPIEKQSLLSLDEAQIKYIEDLVKDLSDSSIDFLNKVFDKHYYSFSVSLIKSIVQQGEKFEEKKLKELVDSIKYVNSIYITKRTKEPTKDILLALTIVKLNDNNTFEKFLEWINKNEVGNIHELFFENIINLFDNIHKQRSYKVFVAMPYISYKRVNECNKLFREVLSEISQKVGFGLELIPIMRFRGESQRIDIRLIESIKECDIFVGDLTTVNDNVIFEVGLAEGNNKKILLIKAEEDTKQLPFDKATQLDKDKTIPFDFDKLQYIPYSNSGYYNDIKSILRNNIPVIVEQLKKEKNV